MDLLLRLNGRLRFTYGLALGIPKLFCIVHSQNACEYEKFIPPIEQAQKLFEKHNLPGKAFNKRNFKLMQSYFTKNPTNFYDYTFDEANKDNLKKVLQLSKDVNYLYPLTASYSDFFVIPHKKNQGIYNTFVQCLNL